MRRVNRDRDRLRGVKCVCASWAGHTRDECHAGGVQSFKLEPDGLADPHEGGVRLPFSFLKACVVMLQNWMRTFWSK